MTLNRDCSSWTSDFLTLPIKSSNNQQVILLRQQNIPSKNTDANIDASCNRTHYGSKRVVCVDKSISTFYN